MSDCKKRHIQLGQQSNRNYLRAGYFLGNIDTQHDKFSRKMSQKT